MYMFCSKVVEEPSVGTDYSFSLAYRSLLPPRTLPLLFQEVSKREGELRTRAAWCTHTEEGFDWPERQIEGLEEIIQEQSTRRKFGPPKVISVNSIVFQGEILQSNGKCDWYPFVKGKKKIRKKNKLEINNNQGIFIFRITYSREYTVVYTIFHWL